MPKQNIRQKMLGIRSAMSNAEWESSSKAAQERLVSIEPFIMAASVALYSPIMNEVDTAIILDACLKAGKKVFFPAVIENGIEFRQVLSPGQMVSGRFGIMEPPASGTERPELELMVIPGLAFDLNGHRLGFGKGYYDRYLADLSGELPLLAGICHDFQLLDSLPSESHDIKMDFIVTGGRLVDCGSNRLSMTVG